MKKKQLKFISIKPYPSNLQYSITTYANLRKNHQKGEKGNKTTNFDKGVKLEVNRLFKKISQDKFAVLCRLILLDP